MASIADDLTAAAADLAAACAQPLSLRCPQQAYACVDAGGVVASLASCSPGCWVAGDTGCTADVVVVVCTSCAVPAALLGEAALAASTARPPGAYAEVRALETALARWWDYAVADWQTSNPGVPEKSNVNDDVDHDFGAEQAGADGPVEVSSFEVAFRGRTTWTASRGIWHRHAEPY